MNGAINEWRLKGKPSKVTGSKDSSYTAQIHQSPHRKLACLLDIADGAGPGRLHLWVPVHQDLALNKALGLAARNDLCDGKRRSR